MKSCFQYLIQYRYGTFVQVKNECINHVLATGISFFAILIAGTIRKDILAIKSEDNEYGEEMAVKDALNKITGYLT